MHRRAPEILTARLRLRPLRPDDFDAFAVLRMNREVMKYIDPKGPTREQVANYLDRKIRQWPERGFGTWAVERKDDEGTLVGWCGLDYLDNTPEVEIGYGFAESCWGQGIGTEAARACVRFGFEQMNFDYIVAVAVPENTGSRRIMEKIGMKYVKPAYYYGVDVVYYMVRREEFQPGDSPHVVINREL